MKYPDREEGFVSCTHSLLHQSLRMMTTFGLKDKRKRRFPRGNRNSKKSRRISTSYLMMIIEAWNWEENCKETNGCSTLSSFCINKNDCVSRLKLLWSMQKFSEKVVDCCKYRLQNSSQRYRSKIASRVVKLMEKQRLQLTADFDEMIPSSILAFLKNFVKLMTDLVLTKMWRQSWSRRSWRKLLCHH